jgi:1A family penicillin-binding protein
MQRYIIGRAPKGFSALLTRFKHDFRKADKKTLTKNVLLASLALILFGVIIFGGLFAWYAKDLPNPNALLNRDVSQSTKIFDRTGTHLLYEIAPDQKRTLVPIENISPLIQKATITAEDRDFYKHHGFSVTGYLRAIRIYVLSLGRVKTGGSTITQQFVKKAILTSEKKLSRKAKELILSVIIEQRYSKDQILQMYLNEIPYGSTNYGIESAAQTYFGKSAKDVDLAEAATLAAIPQSPTRYMNNPDLLKERKEWILNGMVEEGYATREEADAAIAEDSAIDFTISDIQAPHFVLWVKSLLETTYGSKQVETGGLNVITSLDFDKQKAAETAVTNGVATYGPTFGFTGAGLVSLDPKTGEILAMVGSPDYFNNEEQGQVNVTLQPLQPGSSIKPIVYAAAFEKGYTPNTIVWDVKTSFPTPTGAYNPQNYDGGEHGPVTLRKALQGSLNIPAVKTLYLVGIDEAVKFAQRLGYTTLNDKSQIGLSMVLGGILVTPLEHTAAYATFADNGTYHAPVAILKVTEPNGNVLEEWKADDHKGEQVIDKNLAAEVSNVLSDNNARTYVFGARNWLTINGRPVAAKTGTTNEYKDAWTMGYTPSLVAGVWVGNSDGTKMKGAADGSKVAAPIWNEYMKNALNGTAVEQFPAATIPVTGKAMLDGKVPGTAVTIDTSTGKLATELTPDRYRKSVMCGEYHTILRYVDRKDPLGGVPSNPEKDPYYSVWENSIQDYIARHNASLKPGEKALENCTVPTEEDDVHTKKNQPEVRISSPGNSDSVSRTFPVTLFSSTKRGFNRVEYSIDDSYVTTSTNMDGETITLPGWVGSGTHTLTVTLYDDVDNAGKDSVKISVSEAGSEGSFRITNPFNNQTIEKSETTYSIAVEVPRAGDLVSLSVIAKNIWTGAETVVGTTTSPAAISSFAWTLPDAADYTLEARATTKSGSTEETAPIRVRLRDTAPTASADISGTEATADGEVAGATTEAH